MQLKHIISLTSLWTAFVVSSIAEAKITITDITNASNFEINSTSSLTVYGGLAGVDCGGGSNVCDSCAGADLLTPATFSNGGCNNRRISKDVLLKISFTSDEADGYPVLLSTDNVAVAYSSTKVAKGATATLSVYWGAICSNISSSAANCISASALTGSYKLGMDTDGANTTIEGTSMSVTFQIASDVTSQSTNQNYMSGDCDLANTTSDAGACDFSIYPGDGKAWITNVKVPESFPNGKNSVPFKKIRFYYVLGDFTALTPHSSFESFEFTGTPGGGDFSLQGSYVGGLENFTDTSKFYSFMMASEDAAGNVGYFTDPTLQTSEHQVTPSEVAGLLSQQFNCFVATAAWGSPFTGKVKALRAFRDRYLLTNNWGRQFVRWYYKNSPPAAQWIAQSETLRASTRVALYPVWAFSALALQIGLAPTLMLMMTLVGFLSYLIVRVRRGVL